MRSGFAKKNYLEHNALAPLFQSGFTCKSILGKIINDHLKIESRRVSKGLQGIFDNAQRKC
jgi:hypothetical protein